ncbi:hypothetical protein FS749_008439 [Ceratobasidium sp. UAMH 11750]|nr:hypothetical protein FS749_008439 [Ceratobasidium sp. UAMH 11750]
MDSGILSLVIIINFLLVLVFADLGPSFHLLFAHKSWFPAWSPISLFGPKAHNTALRRIPHNSPSRPSKTPALEATASNTSETKPSIKLDTLAASKHRTIGCKPSNGLRFRAPTSKGVDDHLGTHTGCPTFFELNNKWYVLYEDGKIYRPDEHGRLHSAADIPLGSARPSCRIEQFTLALDEEAYLCTIDEKNHGAERIGTWCLDHDPEDSSTGSPSAIVPGRGCFHFRAVPPVGGLFGYPCNSKSRAPLCESLRGLGHNPPLQVWSMVGAGTDQHDATTPPAPLIQSPEPSPSTSRTPADFTVPNARTSIERRTCTHCNKVLRRPSALRIHINSHLNIRPCRCPEENCNYASTNETNLRRHMQKMHGESYPDL